MENFIVIGILALIVGAIIFYLIREKKKGVKCIGCPYAKQCAGKCHEQHPTPQEDQDRTV